MWEKLSGQTVGTAPQGADELPHVLVAHGDNSASISIARTGKNLTMRHMGRTHGVALSWLSGEIREKRCELGYIKTSDMAADIFTKFHPREKKETWRQMCGIICVFGPDEWDKKLGTCGIGHATAMEG